MSSSSTIYSTGVLLPNYVKAGPAASFCVADDNYLKLRCPASKPYIKVEWIEIYSSCYYSGNEACQLFGPVSIIGNDLSDRCDIFNLRLHFLCHGVENECHIPNDYLMHPSQYESDYGASCYQGRPGGFLIKFSCERSNNGRQEISRLYGQCRRPLIDRTTTTTTTPSSNNSSTEASPSPTTPSTTARHIPTTTEPGGVETTLTYFITSESTQFFTSDLTLPESTTVITVPDTAAANISCKNYYTCSNISRNIRIEYD